MPLFRTYVKLGVSKDNVDRAAGLIKGVAIITTGCAKGHGMLVDEQTLSTTLAACNVYESGLKVKFNPNTFDHGAAAIAGVIPKGTIRIDSAAGVLRGDMQVDPAFAARDYLFNLAETQPDTFGLSIDFDCAPEEKGGVLYARCTEIFAVTVVDQPAANPSGLWAVNPEQTKPTSKPMALSSEDKAEMQSIITEAIRPLATEVASMKTKLSESPTLDLATVSAEEKKAAKVADGDDEETMRAKVTKYRANLNAPMTRKDFFAMSREIGAQGAAGNSPTTGKGEDGTNGNGMSKFSLKVEELISQGADRGAAVQAVQKAFPALYNEHMKGKIAGNGAVRVKV
jgi:hypothetical protein